MRISSYPASLHRTVRTIRMAKYIRTFLTVLEFRNVKHPYMGVDVSISKNVEFKKPRIRTVRGDEPENKNYHQNNLHAN